MHESPQSAAPALVVSHESHLLLNTPGAQAASSAVTANAAVSRAPGYLIRSTPLHNGGTIDVLDSGDNVCLSFTRSGCTTYQHITADDALRLAELLNPAPLAPTTTDGESHLTDESVLAECAESQERARVQMYGERTGAM